MQTTSYHPQKGTASVEKDDSYHLKQTAIIIIVRIIITIITIIPIIIITIVVLVL